MAIPKDGIEIRELDDWHDRAGPKRTDQWVANRIAMEAARAWLAGGGQRRGASGVARFRYLAIVGNRSAGPGLSKDVGATDRAHSPRLLSR